MTAKTEQLLTLEEACQCPLLTMSRRSKRSIPYSTLYRWVSRGVKGGVVLESIVIGGVRMVSEDAIKRFIEAATEARQYKPRKPGITARTPTQRRRASEASSKRLKAKGM
jgi:hypothetical protein